MISTVELEDRVIQRGLFLDSITTDHISPAGNIKASSPAGKYLPPPAGQRTFPEAAQRGTLKIVNGTSAELNGKPIRLAPGLRIFTPQNALVFAHTLAGKSLKVNYVIEASTGMLHTAWILTEAEAKQPRKGSGATVTNIRTGT